MSAKGFCFGLATVFALAGAGAGSSGCGGSSDDGGGSGGGGICNAFYVSADHYQLFFSPSDAPSCAEVDAGVLSINFSCSVQGGASYSGSITVTRSGGVITSYDATINGRHCSGTIT